MRPRLAFFDFTGCEGCQLDALNLDGEELVDQPELDRKKLRVSGPFTVEAVQPAEETLDLDSPIDSITLPMKPIKPTVGPVAISFLSKQVLTGSRISANLAAEVINCSKTTINSRVFRALTDLFILGY